MRERLDKAAESAERAAQEKAAKKAADTAQLRKEEEEAASGRKLRGVDKVAARKAQSADKEAEGRKRASAKAIEARSIDDAIAALSIAASGEDGPPGRRFTGAGRFAGAERTAFLLRVVESRQASALIALLGAYALYTIAVGLHREFGGEKPPVEHSVLYRSERAPPPPVTAAGNAGVLKAIISSFLLGPHVQTPLRQRLVAASPAAAALRLRFFRTQPRRSTCSTRPPHRAGDKAAGAAASGRLFAETTAPPSQLVQQASRLQRQPPGVAALPPQPSRAQLAQALREADEAELAAIAAAVMRRRKTEAGRPRTRAGARGAAPARAARAAVVGLAGGFEGDGIGEAGGHFRKRDAREPD